MNRLRKFASRFFFPLLIILIAGLLAWQNYTPGTILSGWDTLHPEFNFGLAFERAIFGVWRPEQGVGALAIHSHMSDLPRIVFLWLSSFVLPVNFLRYFYFFTTLALGPLGVYFFVKYVLKAKKFLPKSAAFLGASYYLLNLGTLQHFYVPFEMFAALFAFLPWLFLFALKFLNGGRRKTLVFFAVLSSFSTPVAYAATLFYAYFASLVLFLFLLSLFSKEKIKRFFLIILVVLATNAYWLLPNIYSVARQGSGVSDAKINRLFSPEAFLINKNYGNVGNILIHKNFLFSWREHSESTNKFVPLLDEWDKHLERPLVLPLGYSFAAISILGLALTVLRRNRVGLSLLFVSFLALFFLFNENGLFGNFYLFLEEHFDLFKEGLRMPFTKFSIPFMFAGAFYFAFAFNSFFKVFRIGAVAGLLIFAGLVFYMLPAFSGNLISPSMRVKVPAEYFQISDWFNNNQIGRIAKLPLHTPFGWTYYDWGYEGAGFTSFAIENPMLERDFDRWSPYNESFYSEAAFALYADDNEAFERVLEKYQVKYLLLDESIINPGGESGLLYLPETKEMLGRSKIVSKLKNFGFLTVYEVNSDQPLIITPSNYTSARANLTYSQFDPVYEKFGTYIDGTNGVYYPFVNFDGLANVEVKREDGRLILEDKESPAKVILPLENILIEDLSQERGFSEPYNCDPNKAGRVEKQRLGNAVLYKASGGGVACDYFGYPELAYSQGYLMRIKGENKEGRSLKIYIFNNTSKWSDIEELLPASTRGEPEGQFDEYFLILPRNIEGQGPASPSQGGYTLNVETRSFGRIASENIIQDIEITPIPYEFLTQVKIGNPEIFANQVSVSNIRKFGAWLYTANVDGGGLFVLPQGYEKGWVAAQFPVSNREAASSAYFQFPVVLDHVKINSWANGWLVKNTQYSILNTVYIIYWPQLLEFVGFGFLVIAFLMLTKIRGKARIG